MVGNSSAKHYLAEGEMAKSSDHNPIRFGLKALLLFMALLAVMIGMYVIGYQNGYKAAQQESRADYAIFDAGER